MARRRKDTIFGGVVLAAIVMFAACCGGPCGLIGLTNRQNSSRVPTPPVTAPITASQLPAPSHDEPQASHMVVAPRAIPTPIAPVAPVTMASTDLPWIPVSISEPFKDRPAPTIRKWTSRAGGFQTTGKLAGYSEGQVHLEKVVGGVALVPLDKLSNNDQDYVKDLIRVDPTAKVIIGKVSRVRENNTIVVTEESGYHLVHLEGVESLDADQKQGSAAKDALAALILDKFVWVEWREKDKHDFVVGQVYSDGRHINLEIVAEGHARHDKQPSINPRLANAELIARKKRLGVWSQDFIESPFGFGTTR